MLGRGKGKNKGFGELRSSSKLHRVPISPHPLLHLLCFSYNNHSNGYEMISHCGDKNIFKPAEIIF